jgi:hypothetical protein
VKLEFYSHASIPSDNPSSRLYSSLPPDSSSSYKERLQRGATEVLEQLQNTATVKDMRDLMLEMQRRNYVWWRWVMGVALVFGYASFDIFKRFTANQAAEVTKHYLENEQFKKDIVDFVTRYNWIHFFFFFFFSFLFFSSFFLCSKEIEAALKELIIQLLKEKMVEDEFKSLLQNVLNNKSLQEDASKAGFFCLFFVSVFEIVDQVETLLGE